MTDHSSPNMDTRPIATDQAEITRPMQLAENSSQPAKDLPNAKSELNPLPTWILDWAACDEQTARPTALDEFEDEKPFEAPQLDRSAGWDWTSQDAMEEIPSQKLEECLQNGKYDEVYNLVEANRNDQDFKITAQRAIRKYLNLADESDPLWKANELLNRDQTGEN